MVRPLLLEPRMPPQQSVALRNTARVIGIASSCMVVAVILGTALWPRGTCACLGPEVSRAHDAVIHYVTKALPSWVLDHPDQPCPRSLEDLHPYMPRTDDHLDPWGRAYRFTCRIEGKVHFAVWSVGKDAVNGTADDVRLAR